MVKQPVVQLDRYGCGVACVAFIMGVLYHEAKALFDAEKVDSSRTYCFDITRALRAKGILYKYSKLTDENIDLLNKNGVIIFVRKNKAVYPSGHYLVRHNSKWMDPWSNRIISDDIKKAKSNFTNILQDVPTWVMYPV